MVKMLTFRLVLDLWAVGETSIKGIWIIPKTVSMWASQNFIHVNTSR